MFCAIALGALWRPLWVVMFLSSHPGASRRPRCICQICFKRNGFLHFSARGVHKDVKPDVIASAGKCLKTTKHPEHLCFEHFLGDQYDANLAWCMFYVFLPSHVGAQDGLAEAIKNALNATVFGLFLSEVYANM